MCGHYIQVEFVDIMPTLIEAALGASALPSLCPPDSRQVSLCVEGHSLLPVLRAPATTSDWKPAAFMQYAACMHDEGIWHTCVVLLVVAPFHTHIY